MRILVYGAGYVGLSMAAVLSQVHDVTIVELRDEIVDRINAGQSTVSENGLEPLLTDSVRAGKLRAVSHLANPSPYDAIIICVNTPPQDDGSADLSQVEAVMESIEAYIQDLYDQYLLIALKSTVPPSTTRTAILDRLGVHHINLGVVFSPEFLRQGTAVDDIRKPDRVVIGGSDERAAEAYQEILQPCLVKKDVRFFKMTLESAEMCKYVSNCFLATKISFGNEMASLAERVPNIEIDDVMNSVMADHRICPSHLKPGLGFGGSCFPKDIRAILEFSESRGVKLRLLSSVLDVNTDTSTRLMSLLKRTIPSFDGCNVAVLGLTFKHGTDDTRSSPSLDVIENLHSMGAHLHVHDPMANLDTVAPEKRELFTFTRSVDDCLRDADLLVIMTDWPMYKKIGLENLTQQMKQRIVVDGRRMFVNSEKPVGITYKALGSF